MTMKTPVAPLPVTVIGGYLGAGKTTLVNHLLRERAGRRIAVLVNDFGELSIDDDLIESEQGGVMRLAGGCVCCSFGNDLVAALMAMPDMRPRPDHILLETSGVAIPGAVARTLQLLPALVLDAVVVLADAETVRARASDTYVGDTVLQQLRDADLLVLNKVDLVQAGALAEIDHWLRAIAPQARQIHAAQARLPPEVVMGTGMALHYRPGAQGAGMLAGPMNRLQPLSAANLFESASFTFAHAVNGTLLARELARDDLGLVRVKGLMRNQDGVPSSLQIVGARAVVQASGHARAEDGRLVCIALRGRLDRTRIEGILADAARVVSADPLRISL